MDSFKQAQQDMNKAYFYGVPGIICSGTVWLVAGLIAFFYQANAGIGTLIFGGMVIFPLSVLICKLLGYSGKLNWLLKVPQPTREQMKSDVAEYMKYYNLERLHSANNDQSPVECENSLRKVSGWS
ncbi:hypothetical protein XM47_02265 [Catenovulum maritimum]|uniref:Integrase catalytic domain-containing protein n=1 Tax=Catenovulum maritimum TaxID=1513271 RepID=A0A0J8H0E3_9ALTE|nr:hypothetical protein XM47_02265 [Catenovulum maritimum]